MARTSNGIGLAVIKITKPHSPISLYDLFTNLEYGPEVEPFPSLLDEDGELIQFNANEIVMVTAPTHMIDEGRLEIIEEDNLND